MKGWKQILLAVILTWVLPYFVAAMAVGLTEREDTPQTTVPEESTQTPAVETMIQVLDGQTLRQIPLETYLVGVLLGEMPGSFHMEAKKAQAVVARTYTLRSIAGNGKHPGCVCTDSSCCQAYCDPESFGPDQRVSAAREAVTATAGLVLTYEGQLIEATYFSSSGGYTEDAVAVWGTDVPYLRSVSSPGEEQAEHYTDTAVFTPTELASRLGQSLTGSPNSWFGQVRYTQGGGVERMVIGNVSYTGTQLRTLLGLRSTAFTVEVAEGEIRFHTRGFGHRVGMSQYGAEAMAQAGSSFRQILAHYYQNTALERYP